MWLSVTRDPFSCLSYLCYGPVTSWARIHVRLHTQSQVDVGQLVNKVPFTLLFSFFLTEALWEEHFSPFIAGELRLQKVKQLSLELTTSQL